ncbi:MAG: hypothetical protein IJE08_00110 [Clostridia bacterium]|nr:hypothetical protein [Clostridia bacterium]
MKKLAVMILMLLLCLCVSAQAEGQIEFRFADAQEGAQLLLGNEEYFAGLSQYDIDYRLQKKGGTLEELKEFAAAQVLSFNGEEKQALSDSFARIEKILDEKGLVLPELDEIVLIKTTMLEESGAGAYTHGTQIYLGGDVVSYAFMDDEQALIGLDGIMCHELFHCVTRSNPDFRADAYSLIGFTVQEEDFEIAPSVKEKMLSNPDVERHNSYASFVIDGQERDCYMVNVADKPFEQAGDMFFSSLVVGLVPVDDPGTMYLPEDAANFWDLFGKNTGYVIDPEECLADNFRFAVVFGADGLGGLVTFETPELIEGMLELLKK